MNIKGRYSDSAPLYAILLAAGVIAAVAVFFITLPIFSNGVAADEGAPQSSSQTTDKVSDDVFTPDNELSEEMKDEAIKLISQNYTVFTLYYTYGLPHVDEPYGNTPSDGFYTVSSEEYTSLSQLDKLVDSTYAKKQAKKIKEDPRGFGPVYAERDSGKLGISAKFTEMPYEYSWDDPTFSISPQSEKVCVIKLTLHDKTTGEDKEIEGKMTKTSSGWKLDSVLY